ncbi:uncharacterized protein LOC136081805 [Hydra vulgaris]|uniref:Uncharacterized protein LOC136081805 n=1 Tax=Hydra vulgaris TaxID=6087 RepID=A0ABM4C3D3_HYDVU
MSYIKQPSELNTTAATKILQEYFNDTSIDVVSLLEEKKQDNTNDSFNSDLSRWTICFKQQGKPDQTISVVIKMSKKDFIHRNLSVIAKPFSKEAFWFHLAYPELVKTFPEIVTISPICYYSYTNYLDYMIGRKRFFENCCCLLCWPCVLPEEKGILILKNLTQGDKPMKLLDKTRLFSYNQAKVALETLARFHGVWLKWLHLAKTHKDFAKTLKPEHAEKCCIMMKDVMFSGILKTCTKIVTSLLRNENISEVIIQKWITYGDTQMLQNLIDGIDSKSEKYRSKILTMCHGDAWSNNMFFNEDESYVTLIDYQMMSFYHPALDIWYMLSVSTDREFRKVHLRNLLQDYFKVFVSYAKDAGVEMIFEEFEEEINIRRDVMLSLGLTIMPNVLSPFQIDFGGWRSISELNKKREREIGGAPKPDDHPMVREIRRRVLGIVLEAEEIGFI